jgi:hypothetical protein
MKKTGWVQPKSTVEKQLPKGRQEEIRASNHFGNPHGRIVGNDCKLIRWHIIPSPHRKISEVLSCHCLLRTQRCVLEAKLLPFRDPESPVNSGRCGVIETGSFSGPAFARVRRFFVSGVGSAKRAGDVFSRT